MTPPSPTAGPPIAPTKTFVRLVALNKVRAQEEARGIVRWLRPDCQIPRFGSAEEKAELDLVGGEAAEAPAVRGKRPPFPNDDFSRTAAAMAALASASGPLSAHGLAAMFKARQIAPKISAVLAAQSPMGFVTTAGGGANFALRLAA